MSVSVNVSVQLNSLVWLWCREEWWYGLGEKCKSKKQKKVVFVHLGLGFLLASFDNFCTSAEFLALAWAILSKCALLTLPLASLCSGS